MKKEHVGLLILSIIALFMFGAMMFFLKDLLFGDVKATYEEAMYNSGAYSEQWISLDVYGCFGEYCEETETEYFIPTKHTYYYVIWLDDGKVMPLCVSKKAEKEYLDALTDATYSYLYGETPTIQMAPHTFTGTVSVQQSKAGSFYKEYLDSIDVTAENGWEISNVLLVCTSTRASTFLLVVVIMLIPILGIVVVGVAAARNNRKKQRPEELYLPR